MGGWVDIWIGGVWVDGWMDRLDEWVDVWMGW